jgi:hypothetical protein
LLIKNKELARRFKWGTNGRPLTSKTFPNKHVDARKTVFVRFLEKINHDGVVNDEHIEGAVSAFEDAKIVGHEFAELAKKGRSHSG